ncbi:hypothetical protein DP49_5683 [Burkholderia pseudomallei]|nr:hypothetical protein DP49_5683 [Burkholderia pseudomallei]
MLNAVNESVQLVLVGCLLQVPLPPSATPLLYLVGSLPSQSMLRTPVELIRLI